MKWVKGNTPWNKGIKCSKETKRKLSKAMKGRIPWNKGKKGPRGKKHPFFGKHHSKESKEKMSKSLKIVMRKFKGENNPAKRPEVRKKISEALKGKKPSKKQIIWLKKLHESRKGCIPWNKGKTGVYSKETLRKISEAGKGRKHTKEWKEKMSERMKGHPNWLHKQTEESRRKIGKASKGNKHALGYRHTKESRRKIGKASALAIKEGRIPSGRYGISGEFYSRKSEQYLHYRSLLEKQWYRLLEKMKKVKKYWIEPCIIPYKFEGYIHHYLPDLRIVYIDGTSELIEIKPEDDYFRNDPKNKAKWKAAIKWCAKRKRKITFKVVGYEELN